MNTQIRKHAIKIGLLFMAMVALVVGMALPVSAQTTAPNNSGFHIVQGVVNSVSNGSFVVQTTNQQTTTIFTDGSTQYYIIPMGKAQGYVNSRIAVDNRGDKRGGPPKQNRAAQLKDLHIPANWRSNLGWLEIFDNQGNFSNIAAGDRVIVRADSNNLAKQILIIKAPVNRTVKGSITFTSTDPTHITITPSTGSPVTLNVVSTTHITLIGQTSISGYGVAIYNSTNNNALTVTVQATAPYTTNSNPTTLSSIALSPASPANLVIGGTQQFTAIATYSNHATANVTSQATWSSSNPTIANVSVTGLVTGIAAGSTNLTASLSGITSPSVPLTVVAPVTLTSITVFPNAAHVGVGSTLPFIAIGSYSDGTSAVITGSVAWASTNTGVASISSGGLASGLAVGTTNITASLSGITSPPVTLSVP